ncbi:MAG: hypothetical protein HUK18_03810 [Bacteroidales bacterium]|nr:hypothetical protein [Bacteroidales bacterium]
MMFDYTSIVVSLILVLGIVYVAYFVGNGKLFNRTKEERQKSSMSKKGSWIFYIFLLLLLLFFLVMYIKYRIYLNA